MEAYTGRAGTKLGPLTTTWSGMAPSCTVHAVLCPTCGTGFQGQKCFVDNGAQIITDNSACWPPATAGAGTPQPPLAGWGYYSPGLVCPSGYSTACTAEHGGRSEWDIEFNLVAGETAVGCCPEGFRCTNIRGNTCMAVADTANPTVVAAGYCSGSVMVSGESTFPDLVTLTGTLDDVLTRRMTLLAPMFQLNHQATDLPASANRASETSSASSSGATSGGSTHDSPSPSTSAPASADGQGGGLSTGAAAGVGVGATLGAVFLLGVVAWVWRRKRKQRRAGVAGSEAYGTVPGNAPWEKHPPSYHSPPPPTELHAGYHGTELYTLNPAAELPESPRTGWTAPPSHMTDSPTYHR